MERYGDCQINDRLEMTVMSLDTDQTVKVKFSRIMAQKFADALLQYSGTDRNKSIYGAKEDFPVHDLTPPTAKMLAEQRAKQPRPPVKLALKHRGAVYYK